MENQGPAQQGELNWRLSAHPITLLCFLGFRISALLMYLFGVLFIRNLYVISLPVQCDAIDQLDPSWRKTARGP